jgi:hypothetical protein
MCSSSISWASWHKTPEQIMLSGKRCWDKQQITFVREIYRVRVQMLPALVPQPFHEGGARKTVVVLF